MPTRQQVRQRQIYVVLQGLTAQSPMEAELVAAALTMKEAVFCSNMMLKLGFDESFGNVLLYIDNTSVLHAAGNRACTYSLRAKNIALRYFFAQELAEEGKIGIPCIKIEDQMTNLGNKHRHHDLINLINEFKTLNANRIIVFNREAVIFLREEYLSITRIVFAHFVVFIDVHVHCTALS